MSIAFTPPPLISPAQALAALSLSPADQARVPGAVASASRLVRNYCGRFFTRRPSADGTMGPVDEVLTPPLRGELILREYPINDVFRCSGTKTTVFSVTNNDDTTNQRAVARLVRTGGEVQGFATTGLYLERWASGVMFCQTIGFSGLPTPTIGALANAVNVLGGGWQAWANGPDGSGAQDYSAWPVIELRSGQGAQGALQDEAEFEAWIDDLQIERDDQAGMITIIQGDDNPFTSLRWGPTAGLEFGDEQIRGGLDGVRVVYDAGYDPIPEDLADAVVEVVKALLERKSASSTIAQERTDSWNIVLREVIHALPPAAREVLALYRSHAR